MKLNIVVRAAQYDQATLDELKEAIGSDLRSKFLSQIDTTKLSEDEKVEVNLLDGDETGVDIDSEVYILDVETCRKYIHTNP